MAGKISLAISALLAIAVIYLFTQGGNNSSDESTADSEVLQSSDDPIADDGNFRVAYIVEDSILASYEFVKVEGKRLEQRVTQKSVQLQQEMMEYQNEAAKWENLLSQKQDQELYEMAMTEMAGKEKRLADMQNNIDRMQVEFSAQLTEKVQTFLEEYAKTNAIDLVLNDAQVGSSIMYSSSALDITSDVISGLNAEYAAEQLAEETEE